MYGGEGMDGFGGDPGSGGSGSNFDWMGLLSGLLPGLGSLFGSMGESSSLNAMQGNESQIMDQLMSMIGGMNNDFSKYLPARDGCREFEYHGRPEFFFGESAVE